MTVSLAQSAIIPDLIPTEEQAEIIAAARNTKDNLRIVAFAGASKTTALEMISRALSNTPILFLAFNKRIADEAKARLPSNVKSSTVNALGHKLWSAQTNSRKLDVDTRKTYTILSELQRTLSRDQRERSSPLFADTLAIIREAKAAGYIPAKSYAAAKSLISADDFYSSLEEEPTPIQVDLVDRALLETIRLGFQGKIDFDDQIYLSTLLTTSPFPRYPLVLVDEAQDLSPLNHEMLRKLVTQRIIAVGDPFQSIYAFRGALPNSMDALANAFSMHDFPLTVSFRCSRAVVRAAWFRAPSMRWREIAPEGLVEKLPTWRSADIDDNSAIVCRNNAPLMRVALHLLQRGRAIQLVGSNLGPGLIKILKALGHESLTQEEVLAAITKWEEEKLAKSRSPGSTADRANCLRVFARFGDTLGESLAWADKLFSSPKGSIYLLTIHKAKGLEWDTVYFLDPWRIPSRYAKSDAEKDQEQNARYVAITRARKTLYYVDTKTLDTAPEFSDDYGD